MWKQSSIRVVLLLSILASLLLTAAAPMPQQQTGEKFVKLTINNKNERDLTLRLSGPASYRLGVDSESSAVYGVKAGTYTYSIQACGFTSRGTMNLSTRKTIVIPVCGGNAGGGAKGGDIKIDLSSAVRVVKVTLTNDSDSRMTMIFSGAAAYGFTFADDGKKTVTIAKGKYTVKYYACGKVGTRSFEAYKDAKLILGCPK